MGTGETPTSTPKKPASVGAVEKKKQASIVNYLPGAGGVRRGVTRLTSSSSQEVPLSPAVKRPHSHGSDEECPQSGSMLTQTSMLSSTLLEMNADEEEEAGGAAGGSPAARRRRTDASQLTEIDNMIDTNNQQTEIVERDLLADINLRRVPNVSDYSVRGERTRVLQMEGIIERVSDISGGQEWDHGADLNQSMYEENEDLLLELQDEDVLRADDEHQGEPISVLEPSRRDEIQQEHAAEGVQVVSERLHTIQEMIRNQQQQQVQQQAQAQAQAQDLSRQLDEFKIIFEGSITGINQMVAEKEDVVYREIEQIKENQRLQSEEFQQYENVNQEKQNEQDEKITLLTDQVAILTQKVRTLEVQERRGAVASGGDRDDPVLSQMKKVFIKNQDSYWWRTLLIKPGDDRRRGERDSNARWIRSLLERNGLEFAWDHCKEYYITNSGNVRLTFESRPECVNIFIDMKKTLARRNSRLALDRLVPPRMQDAKLRLLRKGRQMKMNNIIANYDIVEKDGSPVLKIWSRARGPEFIRDENSHPYREQTDRRGSGQREQRRHQQQQQQQQQQEQEQRQQRQLQEQQQREAGQAREDQRERTELNQEICVVCHERLLIPNERLLRLRCNHVLHQSCAITWMMNHGMSCPHCRRQVVVSMRAISCQRCKPEAGEVMTTSQLTIGVCGHLHRRDCMIDFLQQFHHGDTRIDNVRRMLHDNNKCYECSRGSNPTWVWKEWVGSLLPSGQQAAGYQPTQGPQSTQMRLMDMAHGIEPQRGQQVLLSRPQGGGQSGGHQDMQRGREQRVHNVSNSDMEL